MYLVCRVHVAGKPQKHVHGFFVVLYMYSYFCHDERGQAVNGELCS